MVDIVDIGYKADTSDLRRADGDMQRLTRTGGRLDSNTQQLTRTVGKLAAAYVSLSTVSNAIKGTADFSQAVADLSAIIGATGETLEYYRNQAAQIGRTTTLSASQAVQAYQLIASASPQLLDNAEALDAVTRSAVTLAEATGQDLPTAARALGSAMNQFGMDASQADEIINTLAASSQLGTAAVGQVSEALRNAGPAAQALSIDLAETVAGIQALAAAGREGSDAGTALRQVMLRLEQTGDGNLMPSVVGINAAMAELASLNMSNTELMELFGMEAFSAATALLGQRDVMDRLNTTLRGTNTAYEQASTRTDTLSGDVKALGSAFEGLTIAIFGEDIEDLNRSLVQAATDGVNTLTENLDVLANLFTGLGLIIGVRTVAALRAKTLATAASVREDLKAAAAARATTSSYLTKGAAATRVTGQMVAMTTATRAAAGALALVGGPVGAAILAATALVTFTQRAGQTREELAQGSLNDEIESLKEAFEGMSGGARSATFAGLTSEQIRLNRELQAANETYREIEQAIEDATRAGSLFSGASEVARLSRQSAVVAELKSELEGVAEKQQALFDMGMPNYWKDLDEETEKTTQRIQKANEELTKSFENQMAALDMQRKEIILTANEFEVYRAVMDAIAYGATPAMVEAIEAEIVAQQKLREERRKAAQQLEYLMDGGLFGFADDDTEKQSQALSDLIDQVDNFGGAWTRAGSAMTQAVGDMASSLNDYSQRMSTITDLQAKLTAERENYADGTEDAIKIESALASLQQEAFSAQIGAISQISGAAASMFEEQSKEREALHRIEKTFAAIEIALAFQKAAANAKTAITSAFAAPFPYNFAAGAAMIAIMASLGFGGSGGGSGYDVGEIQDAQGTGTVLGATDDKSDSILAAVETTAQASLDQIDELRALRSSMRNLSDGIAQLAVNLVRSSSFGGEFAGGLGTSRAIDTGGIFSRIGEVFNPILGGALGGMMDSIIGGISKTSREVIDTGIAFEAQNLAEIISDGVLDAAYYNVIETTKRKFWGLSKSSSTSRELMEMEDALLQEFGAIFGFIGSTVTDAIDSLGIEMAGTLESFIVDLGDVSFEDMSGEEIQKELEAIFSQQADLLTAHLVPAMADFQQMGEGLFETLIRVANEQAHFNGAMQRLGFEFENLTSMMQIEMAQAIIDLMGGIEEFNDATGLFFSAFYDESEQMEALRRQLEGVFGDLGKSLPMTREGFRALVDGLDLTTEAGQEMFAALMELAPFMDEYLKGLERESELKEREAERLRSQGLELEIHLLELLGESEEALALRRRIELEALDDSLHGIQERIWALQDEERAQREAARARQEYEQYLNDLLRELQATLNVERDLARDVRDAAVEQARSQIEGLQATMQAVEAERTLAQARLSGAESALRAAFGAESQRVSELSQLRIGAINREIDSVRNQQQAAEERLSASEQALRAAFGAEQDAIRERLSIELNAISARRDANNRLISQTQEYVNGLSSLSDSLRGMIGDIAEQSTRLTLTRRQQAQSALQEAITAARGGDFSQAMGLDLSAIGDPSGLFGSAEDRAFDVAVTQQALSELADLTDGQLSIEERTLNSLERQNASLDRAAERAQQQADEQIKALDEQLNELLGIDTSVMSIEDAIAQFREAQAEQQDFEGIIAGLEGQIEAEEKALESQLAALESQLNALLGIDTSVLSVAEAERQYLEARSALEDAQFDKQISAIEKQIEAQEKAIEQAESALENEIARLDAIYDEAQNQVNVLLGIDTTMRSVEQILAGLSADVVKAINNPPKVVVRPPSENNGDEDRDDKPKAPEKQPIPPSEPGNGFVTGPVERGPDESFKRMQEQMNDANRAIAKSTAQTAKILQRMELGGLDTRVIQQ